jgi:hypothetical protein
MLKLFFIPWLFITISQNNLVQSDANYTKDSYVIQMIKQGVNVFTTKLFVNTLEYQMIFDDIEIEYAISGCFNYNVYKMKINKQGRNYYVKTLIINSSNYERAQEKYLKGEGESFVVKLSQQDIAKLKNALVEKKGNSTSHNYIAIKQGDHVYELMDNSSEPPLSDFIEELKERGNYKANFN